MIDQFFFLFHQDVQILSDDGMTGLKQTIRHISEQTRYGYKRSCASMFRSFKNIISCSQVLWRVCKLNSQKWWASEFITALASNLPFRQSISEVLTMRRKKNINCITNNSESDLLSWNVLLHFAEIIRNRISHYRCCQRRCFTFIFGQ